MNEIVIHGTIAHDEVVIHGSIATADITSSASSRSTSPGAFYNGSYELIYAY